MYYEILSLMFKVWWYLNWDLIKRIFIALIPTILIPVIIIGFVIKYFGFTIDSLLAIIFLGQFYIIWAQLEVALRQTRLSTLEYEPELRIEIKKSSEPVVSDDERIMKGFTYFPYNATLKNVGKHLARNVRAEINILAVKPPYLFSWDDVPGNDIGRLFRYLWTDCDIDWAGSAEISKSNDGKTIRIFKDENSAEIKMGEKKEKATLKISDGRTHDLKVKKENNKINIYKPPYRNIKPVVKQFGDIGVDKSHFVYGFMGEDLKNNRVSIKFKYQNILGESGSVGFISEPEFCEFIGLERVKMPGILLNSFEMLFSRRERI